MTLADMGLMNSSAVYCPVSEISIRVSKNDRVPVVAECSIVNLIEG